MTSKLQKQVEEFHAAFGATIGKGYAPRDLQLRWDLIDEEYNELAAAMRVGQDGKVNSDKFDVIGAIDALCDLKFVIDGAFVAWGLDAEEFQDEVYRSNMSKAGGGQRKDGKVLKGPNYFPPNLYAIFTKQAAQAIFSEDEEEVVAAA